uniref:Uncharacterized protein n=1 Tax=Glossina austeni TaxID=7395 RepID=A0A1A9UDV2_GLOAU
MFAWNLRKPSLLTTLLRNFVWPTHQVHRVLSEGLVILGPMPGSAHQQQMPQSMSTGNNTIGGHGGHDRGGGGAGGGGGGGGGMPVAGPGGPHCQMSGSQPLVMPAFPLRNSHSAHTPHYSPYSPSRLSLSAVSESGP